MSEPPYNDELAAFQTALARLTPAPEGINIARLLFQAGQRSAPRRSWACPCAAAASLMLALALGSVLVFRPTPQPPERIVQVFVQPPTPPAIHVEQPIPPVVEMPDTPRPAGEGDYLQLRREVLAKGLDALPAPAPWPAAAPADDADTLLDLPRGSRESWFLRFTRSLKSGDAS
jgi:hypothetical protein